MGITVEELGRYDPYTDKFIKNTTTDRIGIGTDGNLYKLTVSNGDKFLPIDELYTKADMVDMLTKLQTEIKEMKPAWLLKLNDLVSISEINNHIQEKIDKLRGNKDGYDN